MILSRSSSQYFTLTMQDESFKGLWSTSNLYSSTRLSWPWHLTSVCNNLIGVSSVVLNQRTSNLRPKVILNKTSLARDATLCSFYYERYIRLMRCTLTGSKRAVYPPHEAYGLLTRCLYTSWGVYTTARIQHICCVRVVVYTPREGYKF